MHTAGHITEDGFHLKRVFEADVDVNSLAEHPAVGGQGEVGHHSALCCYPHVKVEIRDSSQICTTAPIFSKSNYFRQKYLEIPSCAVSLFIYIWL